MIQYLNLENPQNTNRSLEKKKSVPILDTDIGSLGKAPAVSNLLHGSLAKEFHFALAALFKREEAN